MSRPSPIPSSEEAATCPNCGAAVTSGARFCASCGTPLSAGLAATAGSASEERKLATILFADVMGSTGLGEQLDPERLRVLLRDYFAAMAAVIEEWSGTVEKYIGDAILAVFGVPTAREDDAVRALHAATDMLARINSMNDEFEKRHGVRLAVRIGVNTGEVLAPSSARPGGQFLVSGDPVNVASRLEQAAEPGTVLVGERTYAAARHAFEFGEAAHLDIKGKSEPVVARRLGDRKAHEEPGVRFQAPMVGRDRELGTLVGLLDAAIETEQPRLVVVSGSAGIGKSRLLREFVTASTERHEDLVVLRGRCLAAGHGITFWALGEILRATAGISLDEPADEALAKLRHAVDSVLKPMGLRPNELDETFFALATSASLQAPNNPLDLVEPESVGDEIARAWPRFLTGMASQAPAAIIVEDLHWADERLVSMLESVSTRSHGRLMVIGTARPEFLESHPGFASGGEVTVIALRPLTESQSELLVTELLGNSDPLAELLSDVRHKADGNPFFLEEILQRLIDEGAIVRQDGRWVATDRALTVRLPDTIPALLAARSDALPAAEKALLQQAAVVGRIFWPGPLGGASASTDGRDPMDLLRSLERRGLVSARPSSTIEGQPEFIFRHVLIRDVAYASVPKATRARAHAETARWIEALATGRMDEFLELLAYHYAASATGEDADLAWAREPAEREALRQRAFNALVTAGTAARRRFAIDRAIDLHEQARALAVTDAESALVLEALGDDHESAFHMDEALESYIASVEAHKRADNDPELVGRVVARMAALARRWGGFRNVPDHALIYELVHESLEREVSDRVRAELLIGSGMVARAGAQTTSRTPLASEERDALPRHIEDVERGLGIARELGDPTLQYRAYEVLSLLYWHDGNVEKYREVNELERQLVDQLPSRRDRIDVLTGMASIRMDMGDYAAARTIAEDAFQQSEGLSLHDRMHASFHIMWSATVSGDWDRALEIWPWHLDAAAKEPDVNCPNVRGGPPLGATLLTWRGELDRALELAPIGDEAPKRDSMFDRAILANYAVLADRTAVADAIVESMGADPDRLHFPDGVDYFLEALVGLGRFEQVERILPSVREMSSTSLHLAPVSDRADAQVHLSRGDTAAADELLRSALVRFEELGIPFEVARTKETLASITDEPERSALLQEALSTYERLGAKPFVDRVSAALG